MRHLVSSCAIVIWTAIGVRTAAAQPRPNAGVATGAQTVDDATRAAVLAARDAIWRAWFAHDSVALARLLPRSTTAGDSRGWESRDEIIDGSRRSAASGTKLVAVRFDNTQIHRNGDVAVVFSRYSLELEQQERRNTVIGTASEVFVLKDGVWQNPFWYLAPR